MQLETNLAPCKSPCRNFLKAGKSGHYLVVLYGPGVEVLVGNSMLFIHYVIVICGHDVMILFGPYNICNIYFIYNKILHGNYMTVLCSGCVQYSCFSP